MSVDILYRLSSCFGEDSDEFRVVGELIEAIKPFTHKDLCKQLSANVSGGNSPIYARDRAILRLGDFQRASVALSRVQSEKPDTVSEAWMTA